MRIHLDAKELESLILASINEPAAIVKNKEWKIGFTIENGFVSGVEFYLVDKTPEEKTAGK